MKLLDRVAFIANADNDAGRSIARKLASEGASLVLNSATGGTTFASDMEAFARDGVRVLMTSCPLRHADEVQLVAEQVMQAFGHLDILVHNSDCLEVCTVEDCSEAAFQQVLDGNAKTAFLCTQIFGRTMSEQGNGQIVYVSSIHAEKPTGSAFLYSASMGAIKMLCREAALHLGRHGVRVNAIEMGPVAGDDARFASEISDLYLDYDRKVPSAVLGTPEDLANLVCFLCLPDARYLNGADIRLDGGFLLHYMDHKMKPSEA